MQLLQPFDARNFDPTQGGTGGFPIGKHKVVAIKSEVKPTKGGDSGMVVYDAEIIEGEFKGAVGVIRFNLYSTSQQAVEIAHKQFSAFCHSVGVLNVTNTEQAHRIPFMIEVGLQKEPNEKKYTEVKKFFDANGNEPGQNGGGQQQQQQQNTGFVNNGGQQQQNNAGFDQQQNGVSGAQNVDMNQGQQQGQFNQNNNQGSFNGNSGVVNGFGPQGNQNQNQNQGQQQNNGGGNGNWMPNNGGGQQQGAQQSQPAAGGWGQQRT